MKYTQVLILALGLIAFAQAEADASNTVETCLGDEDCAIWGDDWYCCWETGEVLGVEYKTSYCYDDATFDAYQKTLDAANELLGDAGVEAELSCNAVFAKVASAVVGFFAVAQLF